MDLSLGAFLCHEAAAASHLLVVPRLSVIQALVHRHLASKPDAGGRDGDHNKQQGEAGWSWWKVFSWPMVHLAIGQTWPRKLMSIQEKAGGAWALT